jgi:hypothetical protein
MIDYQTRDELKELMQQHAQFAYVPNNVTDDIVFTPSMPLRPLLRLLNQSWPLRYFKGNETTALNQAVEDLLKDERINEARAEGKTPKQ